MEKLNPIVKKSIAIVTGSRSDFGILKSLIDAIREDDFFHLNLIATGSHSSGAFGNTYLDILRDGYHVDEVIDMAICDDTPWAVIYAMGKGLCNFANALKTLKIDVMVILGDRYEALVAAQAAIMFNIPIAHIHGGEITQGAVDDSIRHAITKLARIHFVAAEKYRSRVIQMGEEAETVFNVGAPGLDQVNKNSLLCKEQLSKKLGFKISDCLFLVTYHPETLANNSGIDMLVNIFEAIKYFEDASVIFTYPGSDVDGLKIAKKLEEFCNLNPSRFYLSKSLGTLKYLSSLFIADVVIGNSSSGIIEAPYIGTPTVNIGDRQLGRIKANSIFDVSGDSKDEIISAISAAIQFKKNNIEIDIKYEGNDVGLKIKDILKTHQFTETKKFMDYKYEV